MKNFKAFFILLLVLPICSFSKTRLGEYYLGFGFSVLEHKTFTTGGKGDLFLNLAPFDNSDFLITLSNSGYSVLGSSETLSEFGVDYIYHFDDFARSTNWFLPFVGLGTRYASISGYDELIWKLQTGLDFPFTNSLSLTPSLSLYGPWEDFGTNEVEFNLNLNWWINNAHAVALNYSNNSLFESDFFGIQYLYSWGGRSRRPSWQP